MQYDGLLTAAVAAELNSVLTGGRVSKIRQHNDSDFTLIIRSRQTDFRLFLSVEAKFPRIYLTASTLPVPDRPPRFGALLRKYISGAFLTGVQQIDFDRVLHLTFEAPDGNRTTLILEIMGKHSNLILISDTGRILGAAKNITAAVSRYRQVLPGRNYLPPPSAGKVNPVELDEEKFLQMWQESFPEGNPQESEVKKWLISVFSGFGPFLASEVLAHATDNSNLALWSALREIDYIVTTSSYDPVLITRENGSVEMVYPISSRQYPVDRQYNRASLLEALDTLFRQDVATFELESEKSRLELSLKRAIASRNQALISLEKTLEDGKQADLYKQFGELLLASLQILEKGQEHVTVINYYDPEMTEVQIELNPQLSPKENVDRYFRKFQKARDGATAAVDRIKEIQQELSILNKALNGLPQLSDVERIRELRQTLAESELIRDERLTPEGKKAESEFGGFRIRKVISAEGYEILYGENSEANDHLTTRIAAPDDIWLHARAITGAHVIIKTNRKPDSVPPGTLRHAAEIAAANSDAKHSSLVPVDYTLKKHVRKPRRSAGGFVTYGGEKTLDVVLSGATRGLTRSR